MDSEIDGQIVSSDLGSGPVSTTHMQCSPDTAHCEKGLEGGDPTNKPPGPDLLDLSPHSEIARG